MLYEFLEMNRNEILILTEEKSLKLAGTLPSSLKLRKGLPLFLDQLIIYLREPDIISAEKKILESASEHGKELQNLNYTLSHVVHSYGAMCQSITELAQRNSANISTREFNELNMCLDYAIAAAVSSFQFDRVKASEEREVQHLGQLVHELRNTLSSATIAHEMIKQGYVGTSGSTALVLEENLASMRSLIDRSLSEVRMRADPRINIVKFKLSALIDQIILTAQSEARKKKQIIQNEMTLEIELETDRQLVLSALANLIQNALKYSHVGGIIYIRAELSLPNVVIEIEDECGGLKPELIENLFKPFTSGTSDQSGLGLGLTIVQRAITLLQGQISVISQSGKGCAFRIEIPIHLQPILKSKIVSGEFSSQPVPLKKQNLI